MSSRLVKDCALVCSDLSSCGPELNPRVDLRSEPWFCGLKSRHEGHFSEDSCFYDGLVVRSVNDFRKFWR